MIDNEQTIADEFIPPQSDADKTPPQVDAKDDAALFEEFQSRQTPEIDKETSDFNKFNERVQQSDRRDTESNKMTNSTAELLGLKPTDIKTGSEEFKNALKEQQADIVEPTIGGAALETGKTFLDAAKNIPKSALELGKDVFSAVANPIDTTKSIAGLGAGIVEKLMPGEQDQEKYVDALVQNYKDRYGSLKDIRETFISDPVGFLSDTAGLLIGGGAVVKTGGKIAKIQKLVNLGGVVTSAGLALDPLAVTGKIVQRATPSISISPFGKSVDKGTVKLAAERGIDLPAAAMSKSKTVQRMQAVFGSERFQNNISKARESLANKFETLKETIPEVSLREVGESIKKGFDDYKTEFRKKSQELYDVVPDNIKNISAEVTNTKTALESIVSKAKKSLTTRDGQSRFNDMLKSIMPKEGSIFTGAGESKFKINTAIEYERLMQTRRDIGKMLANRTDPITTGLKSELERLYGAISEDLNITLKNNAPEALTQITKANDFFSGEINKINSNIGKQIKNVEASRITSTLIKKNSPEAIKTIKEVIGADGIDHLQTSFVSDVLSKSINKRTGFIDSGKLKTEISKYGRETIGELLTDDQLKSLDMIADESSKLERIQRAISRGESVAQGSQTAFIAKMSAVLSGAGIAAFTDPKIFAALIGAVVTDKLAGSFLNSVTGQKLLSTGIKVSPKVGEKISKTAIPAQILRQEEKTK